MQFKEHIDNLCTVTTCTLNLLCTDTALNLSSINMCLVFPIEGSALSSVKYEPKKAQYSLRKY